MGVDEQLEVIINVPSLCSDFGFFPTNERFYLLLADNTTQSVSLPDPKLICRCLIPLRSIACSSEKCPTGIRGLQLVMVQGF